MAKILDIKEVPSFNKMLEKAIKDNWNRDAISDYQGVTLQYKDVATLIEKLHILFEASGIKKGDKIAICGRSSSRWCATYFACITYGAIAVPLLAEFTADQIHNCVNHCDARLLFVGDYVAGIIDADKMPQLEGIINIPDYSIHTTRTESLTYARENLNALFGQKYPKYFRKENLNYYHDTDPNEMCMINYTSGTTGHSKGVMIPFRSLWSNVDFGLNVMNRRLHAGENYISILPLGHMFGLVYDFVFTFMAGRHLFFLNRQPSPQIMLKAYDEIKPTLVVAVPLVIEKIIRKKVFPVIQTNRMRILMHTPGIGRKIKAKIREKVRSAFGGNFYEIVVGGAAFNQEVEKFMRTENIAYCVGYGATECGPLIAFAHHTEIKPGSCGKPCTNIEVRIDSNDQENETGEILVRGLNVMLGYYKAEELTKEVIDKDGWYHTGDLGVMDKDGFIFIRGRSKNMLLGANGQNIYPEEIEDKLNSMTLVIESVVVQRDQKLVALIYPDYEEAKLIGLDKTDLESVMEQNRQELNQMMPPYSKITKVELREVEFAKTAKRSIRRFLYK